MEIQSQSDDKPMKDIERLNASLVALNIREALEDSLIVAQGKAIRIYRAKLEFLTETIWDNTIFTLPIKDLRYIEEQLQRIEDITD